MPPSDVAGWLAGQSLASQQRIAKLQRDEPGAFDEFLSLLAATVSDVKPTLVRPLHNLWQCVPSTLAFTIAASNCAKPADAETFLNVAERALLDQPDVLEFETLFRVGDPLAEILAWLRERAYRHTLE